MFENLIVWGGGHDDASHRHIHRHFHETARKLGGKSNWVFDLPQNQALVVPGSTVIAVDIWGDHIPAVDGVDYVLHNFSGDHRLFEEVDPARVLRLQVWTYDARGEEWDACRQYDAEGGVLYQPWGTDLLAEEFMEPAFNQESRDAVFVGAVWGEVGPHGEQLGNRMQIDWLREVLRQKGLGLRHLTQISDDLMVKAVRGARLAPTIAGDWQVTHGYLPCRGFKNVSYGALMFTNVPALNGVFHSAVPEGTIQEVVDYALGLKRREYEKLVKEQQRVAARYTYRESLTSIESALSRVHAQT